MRKCFYRIGVVVSHYKRGDANSKTYVVPTLSVDPRRATQNSTGLKRSIQEQTFCFLAIAATVSLVQRLLLGGVIENLINPLDVV